MIGDNVERGKKDDIDRDTVEEGGEDHNVRSRRLRILMVESLISVYGHGEKDGCTDDVSVDVDWGDFSRFPAIWQMI